MRETSAQPVHVVLVDTTHPGNIGAVARAMKNMAVSSLRLVNAVDHLVPEAIARAAGAGDILADAKVFNSLQEALSDCVWVLGTSARQRELSWPLLPPREAVSEMQTKARSGPVAMVFGGERCGLSNAQLRSCDAHVCIPTSPSFSSLNLGAAVQILCYEVMLAVSKPSEPTEPSKVDALLSHEDQERFYEHLATVLRQVRFVRDSRPSQVMPRLRRLFTRAQLEPLELRILRGMLTAIEKQLKK